MIKKRKLSIFYIVFFLLFICACAALKIGLEKLDIYLLEYESSQPKYLAEEVFSKYYKSYDFESLINLSGSNVSIYEDTNTLAKYLHKKYDGCNITYKSSMTGNNDSYKNNILKYAVKAGDNKISEFTLKKGTKTTDKGFELYEIDAFKLYYTADESVKISAPSNYTVYINGKKINKNCLIESGIETASCKHMPEGVSGITYNIYKIDGLLVQPLITVKNTVGIESSLTYDNKSNLFKANIIYSEELKNEFGKYIIEAAKKYSMYMENDLSWSKIRGYFDPKSDLYTSIRTSANYFVMNHTGYSFENEFAGEFCAYDKNTFSCRVSFSHILHKPGAEDFKDFIDMTLYLKKIDGKYLIYDRYNNN